MVTLKTNFSLPNVLEALNELYFGSDNEKKVIADRYLIAYGKSETAAQIAQQLLQHENYVVKLFGAQTL